MLPLVNGSLTSSKNSTVKKHHYSTILQWMGNEGSGTQNYRSYSRNHTITAEGKHHQILGSSDPSFLGDPSKYNPEELFLSSLSACHMLWYLHLCSEHNITVTEYIDQATGTMEVDQNGSGRFTEVKLHPHIKISNAGMIDQANALHQKANEMCFIANSCNFNIGHHPKTEVSA